MKRIITQSSIDEQAFFVKYITDNIGKYNLNGLTNNYMGDIPSIQTAHPLSIEYGNLLNADEKGNYTSILPAIGVELLDDNEGDRQLLGMGGLKTVEITQAQIDHLVGIPLKERYKAGYLVSDKSLADIQAMLTAKVADGEKLYGTHDFFFQQQVVAISIWSDQPTVTRLLYMTVRSMLKKAKLLLSKEGVKNVRIDGQQAIYNYEFGTTLFGGEFTISMLNNCSDTEVDDSITTIVRTVEEAMINNPDEKSRPTFVAKKS